MSSRLSRSASTAIGLLCSDFRTNSWTTVRLSHPNDSRRRRRAARRARHASHATPDQCTFIAAFAAIHACPSATSSDNLDMCPAMRWLPAVTEPAPEPGKEAPRNRRQEETFRKVLDRRDGDVARVVLRRSDGACGRRTRRGRPRHRLHLLLVEEPPDRRGVPGSGQPVPVLHRRQRLHDHPRRQGAAQR